MNAAHEVICSIGECLDFVCHACIGGRKVSDDIDTLRRGVHIVVGTPGRVLDMIERRALDVGHLRLFVLHEVDELVSRGFNDQIYDVFSKFSENTGLQVGLFAPTMPPEVLEMAADFVDNPICILQKRGELSLAGIRQFYVGIEKEECKLDTLCDLCETLATTQAIVYCNTRRKVDCLTESLRTRDFTVSALHGDTDQQKRELVMGEFRSGSLRVLIATDPRGLYMQGYKWLGDICRVFDLVINYDVPNDRENYVHRIGRNRREVNNYKRVAINFVTSDDDVHQMRDIEQSYNTTIEEMPMTSCDLLKYL